MQVNFTESTWPRGGGVIGVSLVAETVADAAWLVRMGTEGTKTVLWGGADADKDGRITGSIMLKKRKRSGGHKLRLGVEG